MLWERGEKTSHLTTPPKYWAIYWSGRGLVRYAATRDTTHSWGTILGCPNACTEERIWCQMDGGQEREFLVLNEVKSLEFKYNILTETGVQQPTLHVTIFNMDATCIYECFVCTSLAHRTPEVTSPQKLLFISGTLTFERKTKRERERETLFQSQSTSWQPGNNLVHHKQLRKWLFTSLLYTVTWDRHTSIFLCTHAAKSQFFKACLHIQKTCGDATDITHACRNHILVRNKYMWSGPKCGPRHYLGKRVTPNSCLPRWCECIDGGYRGMPWCMFIRDYLSTPLRSSSAYDFPL